LIKDNDDDDDGGGGGGGGGDETNIIIKKVQVKHKRTMKREYEYTKCREYKKHKNIGLQVTTAEFDQ